MSNTSGKQAYRLSKSDAISASYPAKPAYPPIQRLLTDYEIEKLRVALHWLTLVTQQEVNRHAI